VQDYGVGTGLTNIFGKLLNCGGLPETGPWTRKLDIPGLNPKQHSLICSPLANNLGLLMVYHFQH